ncbi:NAD(P)/FAD-dependent oxidoreductase, partial [Mesorhizobium sp.]
GRATGVRLASGDFHVASKAVIAGVAPKALTGKLLPNGSGDAGFDAAMKKFRHAPGTMMIHLALDDLPDWSAGAELRHFAYVHLAPSLNAMSRTYQQAIAGVLPDQPVLVVGQPTAVDPSRAPEGKHVLWVQVRMLPAEILGDAAGKIAPGSWDAVKDAYAERVLDIIESYAAGLRQKILGRAIFSPLDLERENPNLVGGDQICGSHHLAQNFLFRPARGFARWNTPVSNLYLTGAATWPGAGTGAGSGFMLAQQLGGH